MPIDQLGIVAQRTAARDAVIAANPGHANRILGKRVYVQPAKVHHIVVNCREFSATGDRTVRSADAVKPFVLAARPKRVPMRQFRPVRIAKIIDAVCRAWEIEGADLHTPCRQRRLAWPRFAAYRIISLTFGWSTPEIGKIFSRDHTTILHGLQRAQWLLERDRDWSRRYALAVAELKSAETDRAGDA